MLYTHECLDDEIAYFKIDLNLIGYQELIKEMFENSMIWTTDGISLIP